MGTVEETYKKVSQLQHVLLRPDTYVGSIEYSERTPMWVYDSEEGKIVSRDISYVPGLYKIFDEILVNAADNKQRDPKMSLIKITIDKSKNEISVYNNGKGIPIVFHKDEKMYVPELIFGTLLTSSNYNDNERKVTGGRNGYGAKLCNIFSKKFTIETQSKAQKKHFKQTWVNNMKKDEEAEITEQRADDDFTKITFVPDLQRFKMTELDDDIIALMSRRAFDVAGSVKGIKVYLNGKKLPASNSTSTCIPDTRTWTERQQKVAYCKPHDRWDVAVTLSNGNFQQVSFVNSIATTKGGRHVDYVSDLIVAKVIEVVKKKLGTKSGINVKPFQIKNHLWVFVNALIENPTFDSQTKETMTLAHKDFGSKFSLPDSFVKDVLKCGITESIMTWVRFKQMEQQDKKCSSKKTSKLKGLPKLEDANHAGTKKSRDCTLILTEGDSAKSLAVAGLGVVGRDKYGVFPLRGKMLNVREGTHKQIVENEEVNALLRIVGLQYKKKYESEEDMNSLRYGKIMIMTDQDQDGSHIKGLVINFIHANWPNLLKKRFLEEFITPIVKATKGNDVKSFYSMPEYQEWRQQTDNWKTYKIKYYKGLGTSTSKEAKEYFSDMNRHRIPFKYNGQECDNSVILAFSKKKIEERKQWLTRWMQVRKERRDAGQIEDYLYNPGTRSITYADFVNKELILFSNADNERSIPSLVDGLKPGQRKVMFACFKVVEKKEMKVAQLAGAVGAMSAYHHGEQSLASTIVNLAQNFVGTNNINLLLPNGQFGTRLGGGKDHASARYIYTQLNPVAKTLFPSADENVLRFLFEDNQQIEPEWYCPIIPMVLVNGAEGIGTAWSTKVPNYNPRELVENMRRLIRGEEIKPMVPWYRKFGGSIIQATQDKYLTIGEVGILGSDTLEITELPIKTWTSNYKSSLLNPMLEGTSKVAATISDFSEYHTEDTVKFVVKMEPAQLRAYESKGLHESFKLISSINTTSMVLFDANGCLKKYNTPEQICREFFEVRKQKYIERKAFLEGMLTAQSERLSEQARFILMKIENKIHVENKRRAAIIEQLIQHNFKPDPVKKWKEEQKKREFAMTGEVAYDEEEAENETQETKTEKRAGDYDYLLGMAIWKLSMEDKDKMLAESEAKDEELRILQGKKWNDLWEEDLVAFLEALDKQEKKEDAIRDEAINKALSNSSKETGRKKGKGAKKSLAEVCPSADALRVEIDEALIKSKFAKKATTKKVKTENDDEEEKPKKGKKTAAKKGPAKKKAKVEWNSDDNESEEESEDELEDEVESEEEKPKNEDEIEDEQEDEEFEEEKPKKSVKAAASKASAKPKQKKILDSSEDEIEDELDDELDDKEFEEEKPKPKKATSSKASAKPKQKKILDSSGDESENKIKDEPDDEEFEEAKPKKSMKATSSKAPAKPKQKKVLKSSEDEMELEEEKPKKAKKAAASKAPASKAPAKSKQKKVWETTDDEDDFDSEFEEKVPAKKVRGATKDDGPPAKKLKVQN
ncbi:DNA topoisomerase 2 [Aphelenchoides besseyi]|nr:DNA topoisomerase 2 [Aphelenchoides besseyi]